MAMKLSQLRNFIAVVDAREQGLEIMKPELGTKPRIYYKNLWRYSKCFIGGSVSTEANGVVDCVEGASVRLLKNGGVVAEATTDNYGDQNRSA